jgi:signal transduction histidine kinase
MASKGTVTVGPAGELARLSHDSRKLLNIIMGFTELLLDEVPGKINPAQRRNLEDIRESSQRLLALLDSCGERP